MNGRLVTISSDEENSFIVLTMPKGRPPLVSARAEKHWQNSAGKRCELFSLGEGVAGSKVRAKRLVAIPGEAAGSGT